MSKDVYEYASTESENNSIVPADGGMPEGVDRHAVNLGHREFMGAVRRYVDDPEWIRPRLQGPTASEQGVFSRTAATTFEISLASTDLTGYFGAGRIIKIIDGSGSGTDLQTQVVSSSYADPITSVTIKSTDSIDAAATDVYSYFSSITRGLSLVDSESTFYVPTAATAAAINAAIVDADANGGGTVLLTEQTYTLEAQIDLSSYDNVKLIGAGAETLLQQQASTSIDPLITMGSSSNANTIENVLIDKNANAGTILEINGQLRARLINVTFQNGTDQIEILTTAMANLVIYRCFFQNYDHHGILASDPTLQHTGHIANCRFQTNTAPTGSDPTGIKVSGAWSISGNRFLNMGSSSLTPRAIWLVNETGNNGGRQCTVIGNEIRAANGANGTGIEVGGDHTTVVGNRISMGTNGDGIRVRPTAAGQTIEAVAISSNSMGGGNGIEIIGGTANASGVSVDGNTIAPGSANNGIESSADDVSITNNLVDGGTVGILLSANSSANHVFGNTTNSQSAAGVRVDGSADSVVRGNYIGGSPTAAVDVTASSTDTRAFDNYVRTASVWVANASTTTFDSDNGPNGRSRYAGKQVEIGTSGAYSNGTGNVHEVLSGYSALDVPHNQGANGLAIGRWKAYFYVDNQISRAIRVEIHVGTTGTTSDTEVLGFSGASAADVSDADLTSNEFSITSALDKVSLSIEDLAGGAGSGYNVEVDYLRLEFVDYE